MSLAHGDYQLGSSGRSLQRKGGFQAGEQVFEKTEMQCLIFGLRRPKGSRKIAPVQRINPHQKASMYGFRHQV